MSHPRKHVCILTTAHPTDDVRVHSRIASSFVEAGYRVSWVGPRTSHFTESTTPDSRITYYLFSPNVKRVSRLMAPRRAARIARQLTDVDWWYSPDPDAASQAVKVSRRNGGRVIFDIHEVFHGAVLDRWIPLHTPKAIRRAVRQKIRRTCRAADLVIGVSRAVLRPYLEDPGAGVVVRNCAPRWFAQPAIPSAEAPISTRHQKHPTTFMHGKAQRSNGALVVLNALDRLKDLRGRARVIMFSSIGSDAPNSPPEILSRIERFGMQASILLHEPVTHERMPAVVRQCDVGMIAYGRGLGTDSLPNRFFEYMAVGIAVLAPTYAREIKAIIDAESIGLSVDFENPSDVATAMSWFIQNPEETKAMGTRARSAFLARHNWDTEFNRLIDAMAAL